MATVKSTSVTNLDATPVVPNLTGVGAPGTLRQVDDYATTTANLVQDVRLVRIPSNAIVKDVILDCAAQTQGTFDVGLYYSNGPSDGTPAGSAGTAVDIDFFATAVDCSSAVVKTNVTNESTTYTLSKRNMPIWQAAGLSADPGGFFDVALSSTNTVTTGGLVSVQVRFIDGR